MENRGTGLTPNRVPAEWMKSKLDMTNQGAQGPSKTMPPTSRAGGGFMDAVMRNRPSVVYAEARSVPLAPIPPDVTDVLQDAPGGYCSQTLAGVGSFATEEQHGGGGGNISEPANNVDLARGSATRTTGRPVIGQTLGKGTI